MEYTSNQSSKAELNPTSFIYVRVNVCSCKMATCGKQDTIRPHQENRKPAFQTLKLAFTANKELRLQVDSCPYRG